VDYIIIIRARAGTRSELWMRLFRDAGDNDPLAVKMAGIKMGDRLLVVGASDPVLIARLAVKTGLTGRACAVDEVESRTAHAAVVTNREGALVETFTSPLGSLPLDSDAFDVVAIRNVLPHLQPEPRSGCLQEVLRVLRAGGRAIVIEAAIPKGLQALMWRPKDPVYSANGGAAGLLTAHGFRAVRTIAERDGLVFVEGVKPNQP
jgi:ubiquinone/menaquinone biosynthesis C-methylase UbiE